MTDISGPEHDYLQADFYQKALVADEGIWIDPYTDNEGAKGRVTSFFMPVRGQGSKIADETSALPADETSALPGQRVAGVAGVDVWIEWLRDTIDGRHIYPSSFVLLLTEDGNPIIQPEEDRVGKGTVEHVIALINDSTVSRKKSSSGRSDLITFDTENRKGRVIFANMKGKPHWQLAIVCYDDEVFGTLNQLRLKMLLFMLLAFGILLGVISIFRHKDEKLRKKEQEQEYINKELQIACDVQQSLLPQDKEGLKSDSVKVEGGLIPAKAVGGDLYNAFIRDGKLFFCIGDVTGKGIRAAIIMAITQTLFRNIASRESNRARIMSELNQASCRNNKSNIFITLFIGVLDLPTGRLRYCNAWHEVPIILRSKVADETSALPGQTAPKVLVEDTIAQCKKFVGNTEQSDDLTLLAICYTPREVQYVLDETLTLPNDVKEVATLRTFVKDVMTRLDIVKPLSSSLRLALEEAVVNVMEYAYPAGTKGDVIIRVTSDGERLRFIITDSGVSFDPTEASKADTTLSAEERPVGGLGMLLVRELMDSINYERIDGKNILRMTKTIDNKQ